MDDHKALDGRWIIKIKKLKGKYLADCKKIESTDADLLTRE